MGLLNTIVYSVFHWVNPAASLLISEIEMRTRAKFSFLQDNILIIIFVITKFN